MLATEPLDVRLELVCEEAEIDEQWSFVEKKSNQRWLWHAVDHATNIVIAYVFGKRKDNVFKELKGFCRKGRLIVVLCRIYG
jgi:IS1 family transposase